MKHNFMNKENGKIASVLVMYLDDDGHMQTDSYDKVEDLLEDYGAYEPAKPEPLIKDEKVRKAVRAWAEANGIKDIVCFATEYGFKFAGNPISLEIRFNQLLEIDTDGIYTIAELCGEVDEPRPVIANGVKYSSYTDYLKLREEEE